MVNYFINTPFYLPSDQRIKEAGGVPSGTGFTNLIDTVCNAIGTRYMLIHTIGEIPKYDMYMGDDSLIIRYGVFVTNEKFEVAAAKAASIRDASSNRDRKPTSGSSLSGIKSPITAISYQSPP
jgi:hypothetical protein